MIHNEIRITLDYAYPKEITGFYTLKIFKYSVSFACFIVVIRQQFFFFNV